MPMALIILAAIEWNNERTDCKLAINHLNNNNKKSSLSYITQSSWSLYNCEMLFQFCTLDMWVTKCEEHLDNESFQDIFYS